MAATLPSTLFTEANCFRCYGQASSTQLLRLAILARTLTTLDSMAATDPQSLLEYAKCFGCYGDANLVDMMELALLDQISQNVSGGGGGGGSGLSGAGDPEGSVTAAAGTTYINTTDESFWVKKTGAGNTGWISLIV
jgi:hypothetical protein